jgi:outer membrane immunogenic protein
MRSAILSVLAGLIFAGAASAADADYGANIAPERFGWSSFYVGGSVGYGLLSDVDYSFAPPLVSEGKDWLFGVHAGYLHQFGNFVVGLEGEYQRLDIQFEGLPVFAEDAWTIKARAGLAFDRWLITGHGGGSYVTTNIGLEDWAWVAGVGVDYAVTDHIVLGASYSHMRSDSYDDTLIYARIDQFTARLGFKF